MHPPKPEQIKQGRERIQAIFGIGITEAQKYCANLVHAELRTWQRWESGDRTMHPAFFELFKIKTTPTVERK